MSNINNLILVLLQEDYKARLATVRGQQNFNTPGGGSSSDTSNFYKVGGLRDSVSPDKSVQKLQNQREIETQQQANATAPSFKDTLSSQLQDYANTTNNINPLVTDPMAHRKLDFGNQSRVTKLDLDPNINSDLATFKHYMNKVTYGTPSSSLNPTISRDINTSVTTAFNTPSVTPTNAVQSPQPQPPNDQKPPNNQNVTTEPPQQQSPNNQNVTTETPQQQSPNDQNTATEPLQQQSDINSNVQAALDAYNNRNVSQPVFSKWMSGLGKGALGTLAGTGGLLALLPGLLFNHKGLQLGGLLGGLGAMQGFGGMKNDWKTANQNNAANFAAYDKYNELMNKLSPAEAAQLRHLTGNTPPVAQQANPNANMSALQSQSAFSTL